MAPPAHNSSRRMPARPGRSSLAPRFEPLEPRRLLSTSYVVDSLLDVVAADGLVTLREAIQAANADLPVYDAPAGSGPDVIAFSDALFAAGPGTLRLDGSRLLVTTDLRIDGPGAELLILDADGRSQVVRVSAPAEAALSGLTITGGYGGDSTNGAGLANYGTLTLSDAAVTGNVTGDRYGGGIFNGGALTVLRSRVTGNTAGRSGGGIRNAGSDQTGTLTVIDSVVSGNQAYRGGGIYNYRGGIVSVRGSTLSGNHATREGGGVYNELTATLTAANSTFSGNTTAYNGGGIRNFGTAGLVHVTITDNRADSDGDGFGWGGGIANIGSGVLEGSIVAGNLSSGPTTGPDVSGTFAAGSSHNVIGIVTGSIGLDVGEGTVYGTTGAPLAALLGPLAAHGGPGATHAPLPGSPAIDAADAGIAAAAGLTRDQRGRLRLADGDGDTEAAPDAGAFEVNPPTVLSAVRNGGTDRHDVLESLSLQLTPDAPAPAASDLVLYDRGAAEPVDLAAAGFSWEPASAVAHWDLLALSLQPAHYEAVLPAAGVVSAYGLGLDGNGDGIGGDDYRLGLLVTYPGDATRDGQVDSLDYLELKENLYIGVGGWEKGDFDADGDVDNDDSLLLEANFGRSVPPAMPAPPPLPAGLSDPTPSTEAPTTAAVPIRRASDAPAARQDALAARPAAVLPRLRSFRRARQSLRRVRALPRLTRQLGRPAIAAAAIPLAETRSALADILVLRKLLR